MCLHDAVGPFPPGQPHSVPSISIESVFKDIIQLVNPVLSHSGRQLALSLASSDDTSTDFSCSHLKRFRAD